MGGGVTKDIDNVVTEKSCQERSMGVHKGDSAGRTLVVLSEDMA